MTFCFDTSLIEGYQSNSQKARVLTEDWVKRNLYCPICGRLQIEKYENNHPTGDFFCPQCNSDFELKSHESHTGTISKHINDGAYDTMISRITSSRNPNFFFMTYANYSVSNFVLIPNHFFTPEIIKKRKPLAPTARRPGWIGCNIDLSSIPETGKIFLVKNNVELDHEEVIRSYARAKSLMTSNLESRGWLLDTLSCIEKLPEESFSLDQIYSFEAELKRKHPGNNFIKDKLRQQLQCLRDKGFIEFLGRGHYRKI